MLIQKFNDDNTVELKNLAFKINATRKQLECSLSQLAELMGVDYNLIRRISLMADLPKVSSLLPIAKYYKVKVADLLKYEHLVQYLPSFSIEDTGKLNSFLKTGFISSDVPEIFSETFVGERAFILKCKATFMSYTSDVLYTIKPFVNFVSNKSFLVQNLKTSLFHITEIVDLADVKSDSNSPVYLVNNKYLDSNNSSVSYLCETDVINYGGIMNMSTSQLL